MEAKKCGAKTRAGTPCKRAANYTGRCNVHGGKSLAGIAHPNFKHGIYSKYLPWPIMAPYYIRQLQQREGEDVPQPDC